MAKLNENSLAVQVCKLEGQKINLSVAQVKEVIKVTLDILATEKMSDVIRTVEDHKKR